MGGWSNPGGLGRGQTPSLRGDAPLAASRFQAVDPERSLADTRCFIVGQDAADRSPVLRNVDNPEEPFDALVIVGATDRRKLRANLVEIIARAPNPAIPIIGSAERFGAIVDFDLPNDSPYSISAALLLAQPMIRRVAALPKIPLGPERDRLLALAIAHTRDISLEAVRSPDSPDMISYPKLPGLANPRLALEQLAETALLRGRYFDQLFICARCESSRLAAREVCVACRSSNIEKQPFLHHYRCGFQGAQSLFDNGDGYCCPKCARQLRHYGVDYDKPGVAFECRQCDGVMAEPDVDFVCADCHHVQSSDGAARRIWRHYDLLPDGVAALRSGALRDQHDIRSSASRTMHEFRIATRHMLALSSRTGRPMTCFTMAIACKPVNAPATMEERRAFVIEVVRQCLSAGDIAAEIEDGLAVCLPESDENEAKQTAARIQAIVADAVAGAPALEFAFYRNEEIAVLLERLT